MSTEGKRKADKAYRDSHKEELKSYFKKYYADHKKDAQARQKIYYQEHRLEIIEYNKRLYKKRKPMKRAGDVRRRYGLSLETYNQMMDEQKGRCAICGELPTNGKGNTLHVDHNHKTKKVRQLLCHNCNLSLGYAKEDTTILSKMIEYLKKHK